MEKVKMTLERQIAFNSIKEFYEKRLIHQFRKGEMKHNENVALNDMLFNFEESIIGRNNIKAYRRAVEELEITHIKKPETNLKTRLKFLFTGKF